MEVRRIMEDFYASHNEDARLMSRQGLVEYLTTMRYIEKYLKPGMRILEIGAGTGRYSHALARKGYRVDAVELTQHNIDVFIQNTLEGEDVTILQGNAVNLSGFEDGSYDITLLLGPMYHLFTQEDKEKAMSEALRVTKKSGVIFAAYCMADASIIQHGFVRGNIHELIAADMLDAETFDTFSKPSVLFELYRREDIDALMSGFDVKRLHFVAADGFVHHISRVVDEMDEATYRIYLKYHFTVCERQDMTGISNHTLDIFRKN